MAENNGRILVVEDDSLIAMMLEDMLLELGYEISGIAPGLDDALTMAAALNFDAAILDVSLAGRSSLPVAQYLDEKGKPYIFATGYGALPEGMEGSGRRVLNKPYQLHQLKDALDSLQISS
jgi:CheY-like chemotaxis protein